MREGIDELVVTGQQQLRELGALLDALGLTPEQQNPILEKVLDVKATFMAIGESPR